ncbi:MAG: 8-amino-7-oxononanoate synthase [Deltaproteobacteria bacterium]|nr:8-amino-7-oxononanoate synthase [Deltaproteobacteria bacterium]
MSETWQAHFRDTLQSLKNRRLHRSPRCIESGIGARTTVSGREVLLFCSNDYLGLAGDPQLKAAARQALEKWGTGAGASRLVSGNLSLYEDLEAELATFKGTEAALVFSTGYAAHLGTIPAFAGDGDLILSDALNHASIVDACRLSRARVAVYPHRDVDAVEHLLKTRSGEGKILVVTDGVFSMDGDLAPLVELTRCCERYDALLLVDDAHGTGVLGPRGRGAVEELGVQSANIVHMGTFSKALGGLGGFIAGTHPVRDYLVNQARTLIYSTGLPPATLAANREALRIVDEQPERRTHLRMLEEALRSGLQTLGYTVPDVPTPIVPVLVGAEEAALDLSAFLWERGIFIPAIRPPTVPEGASRLRISVSAAHELSHVEALLAALDEAVGHRITRCLERVAERRVCLPGPGRVL